MFLTKNDDAIAYFKSDWSTRLGLLACVAGIVIIGFYSPIYEMIKSLSFGI
jgi:NADH-quinone oxidoreductase subunit N